VYPTSPKAAEVTIDTLCHHLVVMTEGKDTSALPDLNNEPKVTELNEQ
jgi:hypothetical protein